LVIDSRGFRLNVGIILVNSENQIFWGQRAGLSNAWQFPQGGINDYETLEEAMYRELTEEIGLTKSDVLLLAVTHRWLYYRLPNRPPKKKINSEKNDNPCIGQKQRWGLLKLITDAKNIRFDLTKKPEFIDWRWVDYWYPLEHVVHFKRNVYAKVLREFAPILFPS
jgi:putative (di)nucleoside polyphosphate hydrolase